MLYFFEKPWKYDVEWQEYQVEQAKIKRIRDRDSVPVSKPNLPLRDDEKITIGLIDSLINVAKVLASRDFATIPVKNALLNLADDEDVKSVMLAANLKRAFKK